MLAATRLVVKREESGAVRVAGCACVHVVFMCADALLSSDSSDGIILGMIFPTYSSSFFIQGHKERSGLTSMRYTATGKNRSVALFQGRSGRRSLLVLNL